MKPHVRLRVPNFRHLRAQPPQEFEWLRVDANDNCNLKCVYCRVPRSEGRIEAEELRAFFQENVISVENLQFGCGMEPTIDDRLADLLLLTANSNAKPREIFGLQTNGLLLHQHDYSKFRLAGLNRLTVSMDTVDGEKHKSLRGGSSLNKVLNNIEGFREACPEIGIHLSAVITTQNVGEMEPLVQFANRIGVKSMFFREMVYMADCPTVNHEAVIPLVLRQGEFAEMEESIKAKYGEQSTHLAFLGNEFLTEYRERSNRDSNPSAL